jgi:hypothetical protein
LIGFYRGDKSTAIKSGEGAHWWRGASEGKCSGTHGSLGGGRVEVERGCGGVSTTKPSGQRSSEGGGGVPVAGVPEGGGGVAGKLLRDDVVLLVGLAGARSSGSPGRRRG